MVGAGLLDIGGNTNTNNGIANLYSTNLKTCTLVAQLCLTLCNPMDSSSSGSSVHGIFQAGILEWAAISFSRASSLEKDQGSNLPDPGMESRSLHCRQILYPLSHW